jgi:hypothetical protein
MASDWRPIETAPRDGSKFLATDGVRYSDARWPTGMACGRWEGNGDSARWVGSTLWPSPTHWMPLPDPPEAP